MILTQQEYDSLLATREFLKIISDETQYSDLPEKVKLSAKSLLKHYPKSSKINQYQKKENKLLNDNQTWNTPGFLWKTEVEFISNNQHKE